nr:MAG TPA: hypothetical protein [Caudoviricetes sp.]
MSHSNRRLYILPPFKIENSRQYHCVRQEDSARDFLTGKGWISQEYFVYFKKARRISGGKDRL